ncbi:MAG: PepSY domain-containing protein [Hyphomonadaceae bacterium]|nr:PepSY domain-containing protein [Hyphomonadaceae bacterium]
MKARLIRFLFALHRWSGVVLGLLMLLWCLSGFVLIWSPYPSTTPGDRDYRVEGLAPIALPEQIALPEIPSDATLSTARVEMLAARPVITLAWQAGEDGGRDLFDLSTAQKIEEVGEAEALAVAKTYGARHSIAGEPSIKAKKERDEFSVGMLGGPFWHVGLNDPEATTLYISSKTGDVRQRTTSSLRFWTWMGAIPHWLYFSELRKDGKLWGNVIIYTSLAGCFLTVLGLFVGIRQFRRRHSTGRLASPYHGAKFWHHMLGLGFGVLVLTWTFSGFTSMQPWGWLESNDETGEAVGRLSGEPVTWDKARPALEAQFASLRGGQRDVALIGFSQSEGEPNFLWRLADGSRERFGPDGASAPFDDAARNRAAKLLAGEGATPKVDLMTLGDEYYYPGASSSDLPILRVTVPEARGTRFYLDPVSGDVRFAADPGARDFRWWHMAPHRLDFFASPLREIVVFLLMLGVTAVCGLGAWMGLKKLARGGKLDGQPLD